MYKFSALLLPLLFSCLPAQAQTVVTFAGDYGANARTQKVLEAIEAIRPELNIAVGDFSYAQLPEQEWCAFVKRHAPSAPFLLLAGNHESNGRDGHIDNFTKCLPYSYISPMRGQYAREYYFDVPRQKPLARFIMISPNIEYAQGRWEYTAGSAHALWLDAAIKEARSQDIPWIIVGMHKVCATTETKPTCEVGEAVVQQMIDAKVDLVISGHIHAYERSYQLGCMKPDTFDETCIATRSSAMEQGKGTVFLANGTGGVGNRNINDHDPEAGYFSARYALNKGNPYGPVKLTISENSLAMDYADVLSGKKMDTFEIFR